MVSGRLLLVKMIRLGAFGVVFYPVKVATSFGIQRSLGGKAPHPRSISHTNLLSRGTRGNVFSETGIHHFPRRTFTSKEELRATGVEEPLIRNSNDQKESFNNDRIQKIVLNSENYLPGTVDGFFVVRMYKTDPDSEFNMQLVQDVLDSDDIGRLEMTSRNISISAALMVLDPEEFPSKSRARKACRKANIMIHRGPMVVDEESGEEKLDPQKCTRARVGSRVYPGDIVCKQVRIGDGNMPTMRHEKPPFDLPVVFEDDHFAIVNKPAGVVVYAKKGGGEGLMTMRAAIPFAVRPSTAGTYSTLRRPQPVHRLDKPTSGLLIIAKTKPAMINLSAQFRDRKIKKTYTAIVNGIPAEPKGTAISATEALSLGVDVDPEKDTIDKWQMIDHDLEEKSAVTVWKAVRYSNSIHANENVLTTVEMKPKTGRFHQLRRHMSWVCNCPIVGDDDYDGGGPAMKLRREGLFLCSNKVTLEHPFYNDSSEDTQKFWKRMAEKQQQGLWLSSEGRIMVTASIELPEKFRSFVDNENEQFSKLVDAKLH